MPHGAHEYLYLCEPISREEMNGEYLEAGGRRQSLRHELSGNGLVDGGDAKLGEQRSDRSFSHFDWVAVPIRQCIYKQLQKISIHSHGLPWWLSSKESVC